MGPKFHCQQVKSGALKRERRKGNTRDMRETRARGRLQRRCCLPVKCNRTQILVIIELNSVVSGVVTCKHKCQL